MDLGAAFTPPEGLAGLSDDAVGLVFDQYAAVMAAAHAGLLAVVCEIGSRERLVCDDGCRSVGAWVAARAGVRRATGEAWAATASRLAELPVMWSAFAEGELSFDRVAPASELAAAETDEVVTEAARVEAAATLARAAADARGARRHRRRREIDHLRLSENSDRTGGTIRGELFGDRFERVRAALAAEAARVPRREDGSYVPGDQAMAVALDEIATAAIAADGDPDRAAVVIHTDADRLRGPDHPSSSHDGDSHSGDSHSSGGDGDGGGGTVLFGSGLPADRDTLRRLTCDCRAQLVAHDTSGLPVAVGSPQRTAPHWLRRLLVRRDRWCTFPGCETTRHLHAHHIIHWADGGPTTIDNMVMVCQHHHRLLHDDGWDLTLNRDGTTTWTRPGGVPFIAGPLTRLRELTRHLARHHDTTNPPPPTRPRPTPPPRSAPPGDPPPPSEPPPREPPTGTTTN